MTKSILTISGSGRTQSSNRILLKTIQNRYPMIDFFSSDILFKLPVFQDGLSTISDIVIEWKQAVASCDAVLISTPEYIGGVPSVIKNAFEWLAESGELNNKHVIPITLTPHAPRGKQTEQALNWILKALGAKVEASLLLHLNEIGDVEHPNDTTLELLDELLS